MLTGYSIRNIQVAPGLVLAPMSGVTSRPFRRLLKRLNPSSIGLVISEFVSVEGMTRGSRRTLEMMRFSEEERPYGVQIFGYDIQRMSDAARMVEDLGVDFLDINCGCPAPKVVKRGGGCELMRQPEHLAKILAGVKGAITIPLTMKFRSGWDEDSKNAIEIAKLAESEGVEAIAVHGRTRAQLYRGEADWGVVEAVADAVSIPVCGSGDVVCAESAQKRIRGKISGIFIGRASMSNPLVFSQITEPLNSSAETCAVPKLESRMPQEKMKDILLQYAQLLGEDFQDRTSAGKLKQLASQMCRGAVWRKNLLGMGSLQEQVNFLNQLDLTNSSNTTQNTALGTSSSQLSFQETQC